MNTLVVVDMQNDFIDGTLANDAAIAIVDKIADLVSTWEGLIVFTRDTHSSDYLNCQEGQKLPVVHCVKGTYGWQINTKIFEAAINNNKAEVSVIDKPAFGSGTLLYEAIIKKGVPKEVVFCGTCTDICVVSNALILKSFLTEVPMKVIASCCAGLTEEKHQAALEVMQSCQLEII